MHKYNGADLDAYSAAILGSSTIVAASVSPLCWQDAFSHKMLSYTESDLVSLILNTESGDNQNRRKVIINYEKKDWTHN